jgi:hypothetical protein
MLSIRRAICAVVFGSALVLVPAGIATAAQPNAGCGDANATASPGNASSAPGSAFNEDPGGVAGSVYAGEDGTASALHSNSTKAVSQYDVACLQVTQHH